MNIRNWSIQLCMAWTGRRRICALKYNRLLFDSEVAQNLMVPLINSSMSNKDAFKDVSLVGKYEKHISRSSGESQCILMGNTSLGLSLCQYS